MPSWGRRIEPCRERNRQRESRSHKIRRPKDAPRRENRQVLSLVERGGAIRSVFLDHNTVRDALWRHLDMDSRLYTDGSPVY